MGGGPSRPGRSLSPAGEGDAAGLERAQGVRRAGGRPLLAYAIELFEDHPAVDRIVLVVPAEWQEPATLLADELVAGKVAEAVAGGSTRGRSVAAGLARVPEDAGVVVVHDAARPLATPELLDRVLAGLAHAEGAIPGVPVTDTVKAVRGGLVEETLDRSRWSPCRRLRHSTQMRCAPRTRAATWARRPIAQACSNRPGVRWLSWTATQQHQDDAASDLELAERSVGA